jgi:hypothetical protein
MYKKIKVLNFKYDIFILRINSYIIRVLNF